MNKKSPTPSIRLLTFFACCFIVSSVSPAFSQVKKVPQDYPSIQDAIDASNLRDTILVDKGTYYENINFKGKSIVLTSNYVYSGLYSDIAETIIDGGSPVNPDSASCVIFCNGETSSSIIEGFTLSNGTGTHWIDPQFPDYTWHSGGGIFVFRSSPTIKNNLILANDVSDPLGADGASGGGICIYDANPRFCNNIVKSNQALYGCGIVVDYSGGIFKNNIIENNSGGQSYGGGGFWTIGNGDKPIIIENNTIINNQVFGSGTGGAFYIWSTTTIIARNNIIWGNTQSSGGQVFLINNGDFQISYSNIQGGYDGEGNINTDPMIGHFSILGSSSPCIDAGTPEEKYNDAEDEENFGQPLYPSQGSLTNDMGAYGGQGCLYLYNMVSGLEQSLLHENEESGIHVYPNPFRDNINISYPQMGLEMTSLLLYDQSGKMMFYTDVIPAQSGELMIDLQNNSKINKGVYFLIIESKDNKWTKKILKM